jgi:hypothetical protein
MTCLSKKIDMIVQTNTLELDVEGFGQMVKDGDIDPLSVHIMFKNLKKKIEQVEEMIVDEVMNQAIAYNKQSYNGYTIEVRQGGGRYSYDHIPEIASLKEQMKAMEKSAQDAYKQSVNNKILLQDDGELILPAKYTPNRDSVVIKKN